MSPAQHSLAEQLRDLHTMATEDGLYDAADWLSRHAPLDPAHDVGYQCLDGGWRGYQAVCWTCGWSGPERLRGDEPMGTDESRAHKIQAKQDMLRHRQETAASSTQPKQTPPQSSTSSRGCR